MNKEKRQRLIHDLEVNESMLAYGLNDALIGITSGTYGNVAVYDYDKCVQILMDKQDMTTTEAVEWMEYNVVSSYVGETTPVFVHLY
jgi:hypothetical protein